MGKSYKTGNATVEITEDMEEMFLGFLKTVAPNASKIMEETLKEIEREAKKEWPKRKPIIRKNSDGDVTFFRETSKKSFKMFKRGIRITGDGNISVYLKNTAPYSWAIKFGEDSRNKEGKEIIQPQGRRVATELMVKPLNKSSRKVVKALAEDLMKRI
tara:strand:- start:1190 stop:1663 length:474 start_codon:yes stop_codon:yes gene_type:complete